MTGNYSEDVAFCRRAKEAGVEIWVDPSFELQHMGLYPYTRLDWIGQKLARAEGEKEKADKQLVTED
jgi:GT2 family glycosyltransferase